MCSCEQEKLAQLISSQLTVCRKQKNRALNKCGFSLRSCRQCRRAGQRTSETTDIGKCKYFYRTHRILPMVSLEFGRGIQGPPPSLLKRLKPASRGAGAKTCHGIGRPVASQPARWGGGSELGWVEHQAHPPPLDIVRVTSSALRKIEKHPPLGHSQAPPLGHCPCDVIHIPRVEQKLLKGGTKSWGWATGGGGRPTPRPPPPPGYGPA